MDMGYFRGRKDLSGLHVEFKPGLTLILGANGLGKTTFVSILYRLLTGPVDIPGRSNRTELGNISLEPKNLSSSARAVFAQRVSDGARNASATLIVEVGRQKVLVD